MIGFFERTILAQTACLVGRPGGAGGQDYVNLRVMRANPAGKTKAIRLAAQPNLRKDNVDFMPRGQHGHDVSGCDAFENLIPALPQIAGDDHSDQDVGLHDHNRAWCGAVSDFVI